MVLGMCAPERRGRGVTVSIFSRCLRTRACIQAGHATPRDGKRGNETRRGGGRTWDDHGHGDGYGCVCGSKHSFHSFRSQKTIQKKRRKGQGLADAHPPLLEVRRCIRACASQVSLPCGPIRVYVRRRTRHKLDASIAIQTRPRRASPLFPLPRAENKGCLSRVSPLDRVYVVDAPVCMVRDAFTCSLFSLPHVRVWQDARVPTRAPCKELGTGLQVTSPSKIISWRLGSRLYPLLPASFAYIVQAPNAAMHHMQLHNCNAAHPRARGPPHAMSAIEGFEKNLSVFSSISHKRSYPKTEKIRGGNREREKKNVVMASPLFF
ncbi:hypothetical protein SCHPADRAFT_53164 [Schizopora paradoxa]|uniref:Uncharacterized protein n=1 Tax=Schizopora paradoxa TaxID=27342 RepID=A0A0H2S5X1_9AGAM|nr:hypothetical protein SCHPADRAFT_53164 [Schizopora paradoxa]